MTPTNRKPAQERRRPAAIGSIALPQARPAVHLRLAHPRLRRASLGAARYRAGRLERPKSGRPSRRDRRDDPSRRLAPAKRVRARSPRAEPRLSRVRKRLAEARPANGGRIDRRHRRIHAQPPPAAVPAHLPAGRDRLRRALGVRRAQARAKRGGRGSARSWRHCSGRAGSAAAPAQLPHDQHDARPHRPHSQGCRKARPAAEQPGKRPRTSLEV